VVQVTILLYEGFTALDAIGPYEVLSRLPRCQIQFVAKNASLVVSDTGALKVAVDTGIAGVTSSDILLIPGGMDGTYRAAKDSAIFEWIKKIHETTRYTTSVCTGSLLLGAAGILKDLHGTTHWAAKRDLEKYGCKYLPQRYVAQGKVITAAGVSAGIDMALFLVSQLQGEGFAKGVQLGIEYDPQPPFQSGSFEKADMMTRMRAMKMLGVNIVREKIARLISG